MQVEIRISDDDILHAESILLPEGCHFDAERRDYIRDFGTLDLNAVPGSGKTTALLAKLLIIERHLPFDSGRGVLVISHTNAAVDEICSRISQHCPRLRSFPNFIGTIQSFIDTFLATPYYVDRNCKKIVRIDNSVYEEATSKFSRTTLPGYARDMQMKAYHYLTASVNIHSTYRLCRIGDNLCAARNVHGDPLTIRKPKGRTRDANYRDWTLDEKRQVERWLIDFKKKVMSDGILCFDDAYYLAHEYINFAPTVLALLRSRFAFVFVDEMQDMASHQREVLDRIFHVREAQHNAVSTGFQRIGDKNQAIFLNGGEAIDDGWEPRGTVRQLSNSHRLSSAVATAMYRFAVFESENFAINGLGPATIRPCLIVFDDNTVTRVISSFSQMINEKKNTGEIPNDVPPVYKAIAWNARWSVEEQEERGRLRLVNYHPGFGTPQQQRQQDHECLADYVYDLVGTHKSSQWTLRLIVNAILKALRIEGVRASTEHHFTRYSLFKLLSAEHPEAFSRLNRDLFYSLREIACGDTDAALRYLQITIVHVLGVFQRQVGNSNEFLYNVPTRRPRHRDQAPCNIANYHGFDIEIGTVHSVKGQTHTATLYLETFYHADGRGANARSYESQRLAPQFHGEALLRNSPIRVKQSAKMLYVGLSRPTHLLCFAVHKDRYDRHLSNIDPELWDILNICDMQNVT